MDLVLPALFFLSLPLSTAAQELATGLCLAGALWRWRRLREAAFLPEAALLALVWILAGLPSANPREGFGHAWLLAPFLALAPWRRDPRVADLALGAAGLAAAWSFAQFLLGGAGTAAFSHHLSVAYALLPPFAVALHRRSWGLAALLALGSLATRSDAVPLALFAVGVALWRPFAGLALGAVGTVAGLGVALATMGSDLHQRAILWTGGLSLAGEGGVGAGAYARQASLAYDRLEPGFWFPNHAHDSTIQALAVLGPAGLGAQLLLAFAVLRRGGPAAAGLAGVLVGGLTQEVLGDLEVARAAWGWAAWLALAPEPRAAEAGSAGGAAADRGEPGPGAGV